MSGRNQKTLRHYQCRDYLWDVFTQMSQELDTSIDYLINEAMRQYARSRNYGVRPMTGSNIPQPSARSSRIPALGSGAIAPEPIISSLPPQGAPPPSMPTNPPPFRRDTQPSKEHQAAPVQETVQGLGGLASTSEFTSRSPSHSSAPPSFGAMPTDPPPLPGSGPSSNPPPLPHRASSPGSATQELYLVFNGNRTKVDKGEFVIGRSSKSSDFAIRDRNISRRHCAVVQQGDEYWIRDLGSMNGIEFEGRRVESKRIREGDAFKICDYEVHFTYS